MEGKTLRRSFSYNDPGIDPNQNAGFEKPIWKAECHLYTAAGEHEEIMLPIISVKERFQTRSNMAGIQLNIEYYTIWNFFSILLYIV